MYADICATWMVYDGMGWKGSGWDAEMADGSTPPSHLSLSPTRKGKASSSIWEYSYSQGAITANDLVLESCTWERRMARRDQEFWKRLQTSSWRPKSPESHFLRCKPPTTLLFAASRCKVGPAWRPKYILWWYGDTGSYWTPAARWLKNAQNISIPSAVDLMALTADRATLGLHGLLNQPWPCGVYTLCFTSG